MRGGQGLEQAPSRPPPISLAEESYTDERGGVWHRGACTCGWRGPTRGSKKRSDYDAFDHLIDTHPERAPKAAS